MSDTVIKYNKNMLLGGLFHTQGAATGKAWLPTDDSLTCGTIRRSVLAQRRARRRWCPNDRLMSALWASLPLHLSFFLAQFHVSFFFAS